MRRARACKAHVRLYSAAMSRGLAVVLWLAPALAAAEPTQLGGWFGPRIFSNDSSLGYIDTAPYHPMLENSIELGARAAKQFIFPWLWPELELGISPTKTNALGGAAPATIFWFEPRFQLRFELMPERRLQPFLIAGGGAPVALSSARKTFESGVVGDFYGGAGVRFDSGKGFTLRFDVRVAEVPGVRKVLRSEVEVGFGLEFVIGGPPAAPRMETLASAKEGAADRDGDGIPDSVDKCPDRAEDADGFEDQDGCPDIDNDLDGVLDIADKCPTEPETYNGYLDDDGCPDTVPQDVDALRGTIEGLLYAEGETAVRDSALSHIRKIAKVLLAQPSVKIVLVGHTDDREAKQFAPPAKPGAPEPDYASLATDLARARAEAVRQSLVAAGIPAPRIVIDGVGAEEPVGDNATPKGRLANRRVELRLFVPVQRKK